MKLKRFAAAALALAVVLGSGAALPEGTFDSLKSISVSADTSGDWEYEVNSDDTVEITEYTGSAKTLTVPAQLGGKKVTSIGDGAFYDCKNLKTVTIPKSLLWLDEDCGLGYYTEYADEDDFDGVKKKVNGFKIKTPLRNEMGGISAGLSYAGDNDFDYELITETVTPGSEMKNDITVDVKLTVYLKDGTAYTPAAPALSKAVRYEMGKDLYEYDYYYDFVIDGYEFEKKVPKNKLDRMELTYTLSGNKSGDPVRVHIGAGRVDLLRVHEEDNGSNGGGWAMGNDFSFTESKYTDTIDFTDLANDIYNDKLFVLEFDIAHIKPALPTAKLKGDVTGDNKLDSKDAMKVVAFAKKTAAPKTDAEFTAADVNGDGRIDSKDAMIVINAVKNKTSIK